MSIFSEVEEWIYKDGVRFLKEIGIKEGDIVLDFGCGEGHYTIPLAKVVGERGRVYGLDKDKEVLKRLKRIAVREGLANIELIHAYTKIPVEGNFFDAVLCYDVIHYAKDRIRIYQEIYRVLKNKGLFSLYPKHRRDDYPLMELASLSLEEIIKEVETAGFMLEKRISQICLHDDYYNKCQILNFRR
jgi:ubiquinone/menaquinone biosynthesis C-methylase UbiE